MILTAKELCTKATSIYLDREHWTYCQGGLGELGESQRIKNLYEYYYRQPNKSKYMTLPYAEWLDKYGQGRHCTDCSNFINVLLGYDTNYYSVWRLSTLKAFEGETVDAPAGTVLCMDGHVGLSLGNGKCMDFPHYNETCRIANIVQGLWTKAVYLPEVEYSDPVRLEVTVTDRERKVGDKITYEDFVVKTYYSDGSTKINTQYNYTPGIITYPTCQVAIVYGGLVTYTTLKAKTDGSFRAVMIPAVDAADALNIQKEVINAGHTDAAIVQI